VEFDDDWMECFGSAEGERTDGKVAFEAVWRDHFWDHEIKGVVFALDFESAVESVRNQDADGVPIDSLHRGNEYVDSLSGGYTVRAARVLIEIDGLLVEETIPALTWSMAIDVARAMFEPYGTVLGVMEGADSMVIGDRAALRDRSDIPLGWERVL